MDDILKDDRFSHIAKDPRFWQMPKKEKKVKIDNRFKAMFNDERFQVKYTLDKRGRPINTSSKDNLQRFYDLSDDDEDEQKGKKVSKKGKEKKQKKTLDNKVKKGNKIDSNKSIDVNVNEKKKSELKEKTKTSKVPKSKSRVEINLNEDDDDDAAADDDDDDVQEKVEESSSDDEVVSQKDNDDEDDDDDDDDSDYDDDDSDYGESDEEIDRARGVGDDQSSSEEEFEFDADDGFDHNWNEMDKDIPEIKDTTNRLAVCNLDWDRVKADDIYMMFNSFKPSNGYIQSVTIYPSEFGLDRMKEEEFQGPKELTEKPDDDIDQTTDEAQEGDRFHREKLRQYQINRLKYYYAVVVCDSVATATKLYDDCDGIEFETSCTKVDIRFIPDGMTFDQEVKSVCTGVEKYKPNYFANSALGRSSVKLTWDDNDHDRLRITMSKIDPKKLDTMEKDYEAYIASSSDEEGPKLPGSDSSDSNSDSEQDESRIAKYRQLVQELDDKKTKKDEDVEMEITWEPGLKGTTEALVKQSIDAEKTVTPWQNFLQKKKDKKKQRNKERKAAREKAKIESGDIPEEKAAFSDDELPEGVDINDPYFKTENKDVKKKEKKKKGKREELTEEELEKKKQEEAKLKLLMMDDEDQRHHFSLEKLLKDAKKKKKKKNKKKNLDNDEDVNEKTDDFQVDVSDPRFSAMFDSHLFNVDPSAPEFKKTKGSEVFISEKQKRRQKEGYSKVSRKRKTESDDLLTLNESSTPKESLSTLVNSVKAKTQKFQQKKKKAS